MEILWAIVLGGASVAAVIAAGMRRAERERRAAAPPPIVAAPPLRTSMPPAPEPVAPPPVAEPLVAEPAAPGPEPETVAPPPVAEPLVAEPVAPGPEPEPVAPPPVAEPLVAEPVAPGPEPETLPEPVAPPLPAVATAIEGELADIVAWGQSGQAVYLSLLSHYRYHPDTAYRSQTAAAIGAIAAAHPPRYEILQALPTLAQLRGDAEPQVRRAAVAALAHIHDAQVVPLLEQALRDSDSEVVQTASVAIARFKRTSRPATPPPAPARRPDSPAQGG